jgi:hypothetical protein
VIITPVTTATSIAVDAPSGLVASRHLVKGQFDDPIGVLPSTAMSAVLVNTSGRLSEMSGRDSKALQFQRISR